MNRYLFSNLIKTIFLSILMCVFIPSLIYLICSLLIDKKVNVISLIMIAVCVIFRVLLALIICILNKKDRNVICFYEDKLKYNGTTYYLNNVSLKYFKFYISLLEPNLVIPKLHINGDNISVTCYLSKKDIKKLLKLHYSIQMI